MRDELLRRFGELDQVHPAGHVALGDAVRAEPLRAQQDGGARRGSCSQLGNVTAQTANEVLHISSALG